MSVGLPVEQAAASNTNTGQSVLEGLTP